MPRQFYDIHVRPPEAKGLDDWVARAERLGLTGMVVTPSVPGSSELSAFADAVEALDTELHVRLGATLQPDTPDQLKQQLSDVRETVDVVIVHGGDATVNRAACEDPRVDVLAHPELGRTDAGIDHITAKQAKQNQVAFGIILRPLLETRGKHRSHHLTHMKEVIRISRHFDAPLVAASGAETVHQLRAPRELAAFPRILGLPSEERLSLVAEQPQHILSRADRVNDTGFVRPGVEVVEDDGGE